MFKITNKPNDMSEETWLHLFLYYSSIPNTGFHPDQVKKRMGLAALGLSDTEIDGWCREKPIDREQMEAEMMREHEKALRKLAKLNKQNRPANMKTKRQKANLSEVVINDEDVEAWFKIRKQDEGGAKCKDKSSILKNGTENLDGGGAVQLDFSEILNVTPLNEVVESVSLRRENGPVFIEQNQRHNRNTIDSWDQVVL
jgi:hypothetical protein